MGRVPAGQPTPRLLKARSRNPAASSSNSDKRTPGRSAISRLIHRAAACSYRAGAGRCRLRSQPRKVGLPLEAIGASARGGCLRQHEYLVAIEAHRNACLALQAKQVLRGAKRRAIPLKAREAKEGSGCRGHGLSH
jgi:hypothetical protein